MPVGDKSGPARLWEQAKRQTADTWQQAQVDGPASPSSASGSTAQPGMISHFHHCARISIDSAIGDDESFKSVWGLAKTQQGKPSSYASC